MPIGAKLQALFIEKGTNVNEVATNTGISANTIYSLIRRDSEKANIDDLYKVAHHLGVTLNYFIDSPEGDIARSHAGAVSPSELNTIKKYRALDVHGTKAVDSILDIEYERCTVRTVDNDEIAENQFRLIQLSLLPASAGFGSFLDGNDSEGISIPATDEYRQVDFAVRVSGDSMEPDYHDGDIVLVREQPSVEVGEVGVFTVDNMGYIKEQGEDCLISRNPDYESIYPNEYESVKCWGKVVGALK